jgi:hypothetical protein
MATVRGARVLRAHAVRYKSWPSACRMSNTTTTLVSPHRNRYHNACYRSSLHARWHERRPEPQRPDDMAGSSIDRIGRDAHVLMFASVGDQPISVSFRPG